MSGTIGIKKELLELAKKDAANTAKIYGGTQSYANVKTPILTTTPWVPESYVAMNTPTTTPAMDAIIAAYSSGVPATTTTNNITASNVVNTPTTVTGGETKTGGEVKTSNTSFTLGNSPEVKKIEDAYGNTVTAIDNNLARTEADIEKQRQEAIRTAYSGYDKSLSTYGRNAEQLAQMGLTNSGYGDYLSGVAYGNMVGGIQGANEGADEAIRNAYADADQLKLNAEAQKNADIAAAQENHRNNIVNLLTNVGNVDSSVAEAIARSYGFSDDEVNYIKSVYGEHEKTEATNQLDFYAKHGYLVDANGNEYVPTESEIEKLGVKAAYGDEQITEVKNDAATKDETIEVDNAVNVVKSTPTTKTGDVADNFIQNGKTNEGQGIYFENDLALISNIGEDLTIEEVKETLEMHKRTGRISEKDYNNLVKYLDKKTESGIVDADKVKNRLIDDWWKFAPITAWADKNATVTIGDEEYRVNIDDTVKLSDEEKNELNSLAGESDIVKMGDDYYIKMRNKDNKWFKVKDNRTVDAFFDKVSNAIVSESLVVSPTYGQTDYNP